MKITYVTMQWPSRSETFCARDIKALRGMGHVVNVIALRPSIESADKFLKDWSVDDIPSVSGNLRTYCTGLGILLTRPLLFLDVLRRCCEERLTECVKLIFLIPLYFWALDKIEKDKPDIVHLFWGHYPAGLGYMLLRSAKNIRLTMFLGAYDLIKNLSISKKVAASAYALFTHAHANRTLLEKYGFPTSRLNVVHRGIDIVEIEKHHQDQVRDPHRMIVVSRLIRDKGVHLVIDALPHVLSCLPAANLDIVGHGPEFDALKEQVNRLNLSTHVRFSGFLTPADVYGHLYESSVFVLPSSAEGERLPNAVKEAMYAGLTPVVSHTPGIEELVTADAGYVINKLEIPCIATAICNALANPKTGGRTIICEHFDVRKNMEGYVKVWLEN